jgi:hypothetical protein
VQGASVIFVVHVLTWALFFVFGNHTAVFFLAGFLPGRPDFRVSLMMPVVLRIVIA